MLWEPVSGNFHFHWKTNFWLDIDDLDPGQGSSIFALWKAERSWCYIFFRNSGEPGLDCGDWGPGNGTGPLELCHHRYQKNIIFVQAFLFFLYISNNFAKNPKTNKLQTGLLPFLWTVCQFCDGIASSMTLMHRVARLGKAWHWDQDTEQNYRNPDPRSKIQNKIVEILTFAPKIGIGLNLWQPTLFN